MRTRMQKWGNSLAVRIPQPFAKDTKVEENSSVDITLPEATILEILRKASLLVSPAG
jgi:antitoxin component of MazEF toxin-antitoxin module